MKVCCGGLLVMVGGGGRFLLRKGVGGGSWSGDRWALVRVVIIGWVFEGV